MNVLKYLLSAILMCLSGWYYMLRVEQYKMPLESIQKNDFETVAVKEPTRVFGMIVDDFHVKTGRIQRNQNLSDLLSDHNVDPRQLSELSLRYRKVFDVRKIRANANYTLVYARDSARTAKALFYEPDAIDYVAFHFEDSVWLEVQKREVEIVERTTAGVIKNKESLAVTISDLGLTPQLTNDIVDVFAWQITFDRVYPGDKFKVIYQEKVVDGKPVGLGTILGASFTHDKKEYLAVYFDQGTGIDYFDEEGNSLRKALLKYPLEFTRISSRYSGRRFHPVQKRYKAHLGTDFAADPGTPIRSVGDGVILEARYGKANGNYVKVKHNGTYTTQYLHMSKIASGIRPGVRVRKGQTIGYVGSTGLATGPHLCFRFWKNGVQVNSERVEIPPSEPIREGNMAQYTQARERVIQRLSQIEFPISEVLAGGF